jgi:hypothetical protein
MCGFDARCEAVAMPPRIIWRLSAGHSHRLTSGGKAGTGITEAIKAKYQLNG